ncbi:MAG: hypothetical protein HS126_11180 [Anaerolineales bacterium]|nr:hypothetical protein [Anaerolineales bacterium]
MKKAVNLVLEDEEIIELIRILLDEVLPYLATLPGVIAYNPDACTLTFRRRPGFLTLYADKGLELLAALKNAINATWEQRHNLIAVTKARRAPRLLDVWSLLPRSNCKLCGEATCMAFAVGLLQQKRVLDDCLPLQTNSDFVDRRASLEVMLV